jgi:ribonuclease-3
MLYKTFPDEPEGSLARRHAALVSMKTLAVVAAEFGLEKLIRHGHMTGGKMEHISADAMESTIGAIYLDGGWDAAKKFVQDNWAGIARASINAPKDPKTELQEMAQHAGGGALPVYEFIGEKKNMFTAKVMALGKTATGAGSTKKDATISAAQNLLNTLKA